MTNGVDHFTYAYNGLGDRVQQTVNGVTTTYVLDLNAGLTQVLSDGTDTYLYGLSRIGEENTAWDYYLGDAMGSVRQLTDDSGAVSLAQTYQPYGELMSAYGDGGSSYSFTGETLDASGLIFLRARYMNPAVGRFISRDTWGGIYEDPLSLNRWMYTEGNPVNFTDPSGYMRFPPPEPPCPNFSCGDVNEIREMQKQYYEYKNYSVNEWIKFGTPPKNITFDPDLPFTYPDIHGKPPGTFQAQFHDWDRDGKLEKGFCGFISIEAILNPGVSIQEVYDEIIRNKVEAAEGVSVTPDYTHVIELEAIAKYHGWATNVYRKLDKEQIYQVLRGALNYGKYSIVGVPVSGSYGGLGKGNASHWVTLLGISSKAQWHKGTFYRWVKYYNPWVQH